MITPTSGDAFIGGYSINVAMPKIRQNMGICPQFDILWPDITVREHLELYAAIKGTARKAVRSIAQQAATSVGTSDCAALVDVVCTVNWHRADREARLPCRGVERWAAAQAERGHCVYGQPSSCVSGYVAVMLLST